MLVAAFLALLFQAPPQACADVGSCRQAALEAKGREDYEAFHDLAWLAYRKGKPDDPELMLLLARAQSLSGRPGDAIVMLERVAARGVPTDVATSDDFESVRQHPRWQGRLSNTAAAAPVPAAPTAPAAATVTAPGRDVPTVKTSPKGAVSAEAPITKPAAVASGARELNVDLSPGARGAKSGAAKSPAAKKVGALAFTTLLSPTALAYDAVSKRYLIADRQARRIAVVDENTGQVATLAGAQAGFGEINGIAIDPRQGDLWVVASVADAISLRRLQLISGRELAVAPVSGVNGSVGAVTFVRGAGLIVSDDRGDLYKLRPEGRAEKIGSLEYVPTALGSDGDGVLYITAGGSRIARFSVAPFRRLGIIDLDTALPSGVPFTVIRDAIHVVVPAGGAYEIRTIRK